jgi:hypothetical protein
LYVTPDKSISVRALVSKAHVGSTTGFWYAFHPYYKDALEEYKKSYIAFGCGDAQKVLLFDLAEFVAWLPRMNKTENEIREYWHVQFFDDGIGKMGLRLKGGHTPVEVTRYLVK